MFNAAKSLSFFAQTALVSLTFGTELPCSPPMKKMQLTAARRRHRSQSDQRLVGWRQAAERHAKVDAVGQQARLVGCAQL